MTDMKLPGIGPTDPSGSDRAQPGFGEWLEHAVAVPERESSELALRHAVLDGAERLVRVRRRSAVVAAVAGVALITSVGVQKWMGQSNPAAIAFRVFPVSAPGNWDPGRVGAYVAPTGDTPLDLRFDEGSTVELKPGARARVAATTPRGATVLLETGRAAVDVVHRDRTDWTVMAGPYSVRVHGTSFTVEFDPKSQLFELVMRSGVVSVEGPGISQPVEIRGAQRFVHRAGPGGDGSESKSAVAQPTPALAPAIEDVAAVASAPRPQLGKTGTNSAASPGSGLPTWDAQVRRGEYSAVLREAERRGLPLVLATAPAMDIMALGNAARFSGRVNVGRDAYLALRQRFAGSTTAAAAAFLMGRLIESSVPAEARRWYERYEQEAPRGPLVADAVGRRMLLTQASGSRAETQRLAEDYVRRFPDGPYAGVARKIIAP